MGDREEPVFRADSLIRQHVEAQRRYNVAIASLFDRVQQEAEVKEIAKSVGWDL